MVAEVEGVVAEMHTPCPVHLGNPVVKLVAMCADGQSITAYSTFWPKNFRMAEVRPGDFVAASRLGRGRPPSVARALGWREGMSGGREGWRRCGVDAAAVRCRRGAVDAVPVRCLDLAPVPPKGSAFSQVVGAFRGSWTPL